jgi:hypothetical protein
VAPAQADPSGCGEERAGVIVIDEASTDFAAIRPGEWQQVCPRCGVQKARVEFAVDNRRPGGRRPICKRCDSERSLARYYERRGSQPARFCSECEKPLEGRQRVTCGSSRCREARLKRMNPEAHAKREARKLERRRQARREG